SGLFLLCDLNEAAASDPSTGVGVARRTRRCCEGHVRQLVSPTTQLARGGIQLLRRLSYVDNAQSASPDGFGRACCKHIGAATCSRGYLYVGRRVGRD